MLVLGMLPPYGFNGICRSDMQLSLYRLYEACHYNRMGTVGFHYRQREAAQRKDRHYDTANATQQKEASLVGSNEESSRLRTLRLLTTHTY